MGSNVIGDERHWLFAYGSLISLGSRDLSFKTISAIPAEACGFCGGWSSGSGNNILSGLGVIEREDSMINGIILQLDESELLRADDRELSFGYVRRQVNRENIIVEPDVLSSKDKVWIFMSDSLDLPSDKYPIFQSYLDVVLAGCLDISIGFSKRFIETTRGWGGVWVDDREAPKYVRAFDSTNYRYQIDSLLQSEIAQNFANRIDNRNWKKG